MAILLHTDRQKEACKYICLLKGFIFSDAIMLFFPYAFAVSGMLNPLALSFDGILVNYQGGA